MSIARHGPTLGRRAFLQTTAATAAGAGLASFLAACGSSSNGGATAGSTSHGLIPATLQLNYLEQAQFSGTIMALGNGYYRSAGVDVTVIPGGPNLAPEPVVASGKALVGVTHTSEAIQAIINGAPLSIIGATFQKNPDCVVSKASSPIRTPEAMIGKVIGVSDMSLPDWHAFLKVAGISAGKVKVNTTQYSTQPLADGQIDGLFGYYINEPIVLDLQGVPTYSFLMGDYGYTTVDDVYIAQTADLSDSSKRQAIVGVMTGEAKGWRAALADPARVAQLSTTVYGKNLGLQYQQQLLEAKAEKTLVSTPDTDKNGLLWMTDEVVAGTVHTLQLSGIKATSAMFTNEILSDVYASGPIT
jgi:ABC-type nitrate/sulfonate/bicarbonate transport system substrate-binding protein